MNMGLPGTLPLTGNSIKQTEANMAKMEKAVSDSNDKSAAYNLTLKDVEKSIKKEGDAADKAEEENSALGDALGSVGEVAKGAMKAGLEAAAAAVAQRRPRQSLESKRSMG